MQQGNEILLGWRYRSEAGKNVVDWAAPVYDQGEGHLITVAPTRSGKGVSYMVPALLNWSGSAVVIDVKGELAAVTARRRRELKQKVFIIDPFGVTDEKKTASLNPLDLLEPDNPRFGADALMLARMMVGDYSNNKDPFWHERAEALIAGIIQFLAANEKKRPRCIDIAEALERRENSGLFGRMADNEKPLSVQMRECKYRVARAGGAVLQKNETRVLTSILSVASSSMSFVDDGRLGDALGRSTVSLASLASDKPMTVYLVMPPDMLASHGRVLKLWLSVIIAKLARRQGYGGPPTMLFVDEAAQIGRMDQLLSAVTLMAGYGVRTWSVWQDLSQLQHAYPKEWRTLLNNSATQLWFGFHNPRMAEEAADAMGAFSKDELAKMHKDDAVLLQSGQLPEIIRRPSYLKNPGFAGLFDQNPYVAAPFIDVDEPYIQPENVIGFSGMGR